MTNEAFKSYVEKEFNADMNYEKILAKEKNIFYHIHTSEEVYLKPVQYFTKHFKELRKTFLPMGEQGQQIMDFKENYFIIFAELIIASNSNTWSLFAFEGK